MVIKLQLHPKSILDYQSDYLNIKLRNYIEILSKQFEDFNQ